MRENKSGFFSEHSVLARLVPKIVKINLGFLMWTFSVLTFWPTLHYRSFIWDWMWVKTAKKRNFSLYLGNNRKTQSRWN